MKYLTKKSRKLSHTYCTKTIKYLGINLNKEVKNLYIENFKTLMKEIEENKQKKIYSMFIRQKN